MQAQAAHSVGDWSSVINYLQQLILLNRNEIAHSEQLLELALSVFECGDFQERWETSKVLINLGTVAINPLVDILEDEDAEDELCWFAARTLGELQHPDAIIPLVELLKNSEDEELKAIAASAIAQIGTIAIPVIVELLNHQDTRLLAVRSLAYIRRTEIIAPLLSVVQDAQAAVRAAAIEALSSFHDERVPPALLNALNDLSAIVRRTAIQGLSFRSDLCSQLNLVAKIQPKLYDFNIEVCCAAANALARIGGDDAAHHLYTVLISLHTPITLQLEIIRALVWLESLTGLEYLQQALKELTSETLWQEIVTVLGRVQKPELITSATAILLEIVRLPTVERSLSPHPATKINSVKSAIALSLGQLGSPQAIESLTVLTVDTDELVRLHAIAALKKVAPKNRGVGV
ncbi:HEAT repeat domain-containing protein [Anabaena subtropica]|uniref:HEAT repeat domain-containing protein n=1 Tax=Anabaena subtropica FACHB-260 TaxID=2692884 RepID=A0ABR8CPF9_9NOST|nr:HEAT repeat domain-containing protein [Anabaena subtropica]MBD2344067.1 HEAT repeat domain-containing protein [Anabaena subtropica FACHB-260]